MNILLNSTVTRLTHVIFLKKWDVNYDHYCIYSYTRFPTNTSLQYKTINYREYYEFFDYSYANGLVDNLNPLKMVTYAKTS